MNKQKQLLALVTRYINNRGDTKVKFALITVAAVVILALCHNSASAFDAERYAALQQLEAQLLNEEWQSANIGRRECIKTDNAQGLGRLNQHHVHYVEALHSSNNPAASNDYISWMASLRVLRVAMYYSYRVNRDAVECFPDSPWKAQQLAEIDQKWASNRMNPMNSNQ